MLRRRHPGVCHLAEPHEGVRRRWKYWGLLTAGAAAAVLPWAVADPVFGIANYTVTPSAQLAWAAVLLLVSLAADAVRLRRQK